jgi:hypothetical protein
MAKGKNRAVQGRKLEIKVIPPSCLNLTLAEITRVLGPGPLLWPGGAGRAQGLKFEHYDRKKKRGRKPKAPEAASDTQKRGVSGKSSS